MKQLERWVGISLVNLAIVALLGMTLRAKLIFSIPFVNFKNTLHAHSHFAFGGWITLALLALITYQFLPRRESDKPVYKWLLGGILFNAVGMLVSFPFQGYAFFSILFSTLFIFVTYAFSWVFIRDLRTSKVTRSVRVLVISAMISMVLSSVGAFTLAYLLATESTNVFLYKDAIYTYLHLQYSGFFTLTVFALLFHQLKIDHRSIWRFSVVLVMSVIPALFMSYLWHNPNLGFRIVAFLGSALTVAALLLFFGTLKILRPSIPTLKPIVRRVGMIALIAFVFKMVFQALTIVPSLGTLVFANRPVIIGFLHLVLLAFISLYLLAHFIQSGLLSVNRLSSFAIWLFITGVLINEIVLFTQGLGFMLMMTNTITQWLLLVAAVALFVGALLIAYSKLTLNRPFQFNYSHTRLSNNYSQS